METAAIAILAALLGYLAKGREFLRDRRFVVYSEFAGSFLRAAHAGAALFSLHTSLGPEMRKPEHREVADRFWRDWNDAASAFETDIAKLRLIASGAVVQEAARLEEFIESNVRKVPPLWPENPKDPTATWGEAARYGPARVEREAIRLAAEFGSAAQRDMKFKPLRRNNPPQLNIP